MDEDKLAAKLHGIYISDSDTSSEEEVNDIDEKLKGLAPPPIPFHLCPERTVVIPAFQEVTYKRNQSKKLNTPPKILKSPNKQIKKKDRNVKASRITKPLETVNAPKQLNKSTFSLVNTTDSYANVLRSPINVSANERNTAMSTASSISSEEKADEVHLVDESFLKNHLSKGNHVQEFECVFGPSKNITSYVSNNPDLQTEMTGPSESSKKKKRKRNRNRTRASKSVLNDQENKNSLMNYLEESKASQPINHITQDVASLLQNDVEVPESHYKPDYYSLLMLLFSSDDNYHQETYAMRQPFVVAKTTQCTGCNENIGPSRNS